MATPYMNLDLPVPTVTPGPLYAQKEVTAFTQIDSHNHSSGQGVTIPVVGINVDADFPFNSFNITGARSFRTEDQGAPLGLGTDLHCVYSVNGDLYYNNGIGQQIKITAGGGLNATSIGGIGGDYATSPASVFYTQLSVLFTFWQNTNQAANIECGPIKLHTLAVGGSGVTISPPVGLASDYGITLPLANPLSTKLVGWDSTGNLIPAYDVDNSSLEIFGTILRIKDLGVTTTKIDNQAVTAAKIANNITLNGNIASTGTLTSGTSLAATTSLGVGTSATIGTTLTINGLLLSRDPTVGAVGLSISGGDGYIYPNGGSQAGLRATNFKTLSIKDTSGGSILAITTNSGAAAQKSIQGRVSSAGAFQSGDGFTSSQTGTGTYNIVFTVPFNSVPAATVSTTGGANVGASISALTASGMTINTFMSTSGANFNRDFSFIAMGPR